MRSQRGVSLVELMVGVAAGLWLVAVASATMIGQLREHRALLVESRLVQDLRTSADVIVRDLRRAGYWGDAAAAVRPVSSAANPYELVAPASAASDAVAFRYSRDTVEDNVLDSNEQFGFRLRRGVIEMLLGNGGWQAMTDSGTMVVTAFSVTPLVQDIALQNACAQTCSAGAACSPVQQVRSLAVSISARSAADAQVVRSVRSTVRLRNDRVSGRCAP